MKRLESYPQAAGVGGYFWSWPRGELSRTGMRVTAFAGLTIVGILAVIAAGLWGWLVWAEHHPTGLAIEGRQFTDVGFDLTRSQVRGRLGPPAETVESGQATSYSAEGFGPTPTGVTCDYYSEADAIQDAGAMRFCYRSSDGVLVEKAAWNVAVPSDSRFCVWTAKATEPTCR